MTKNLELRPTSNIWSNTYIKISIEVSSVIIQVGRDFIETIPPDIDW